MDEFGANATGTYETPNFIRPQEGAQDRSAEGLLRAAGSGLEQGIELTSAFKGREFRGELDAAVNQEIGMKIASTQEAQPSDTQEFRDAIERAKQVYAQGGAGTRMRTNLLAEKLTREKAGANPLFANVYRQVAREVLSDYDATLQFWTAAEESAARQAQSEAATKASLEKSVYRMHARAGGRVPFPKTPESMTPQEASEYIMEASREAAGLAEEERQREQMRDDLQMRQAAAAEMTAANTGAAATIAMEEKLGERQEVNYIGTIRGNFDNSWSGTTVRELLLPVANGTIQTISPEFRQAALQKIAVVRNDFLQRINGTPYFSNAGRVERDRFIQHMESRFAEAEAIINGPFSELKAVADQAKFASDQMSVDAYNTAYPLMRLNKIYGPAAGIFLQDSLMRNTDAAIQGREKYSQALQDSFAKSSEQSIRQGGDLTGLSADDSSILRRSSIKMMSSMDPRIEPLISDPETWRINTMRALDGIELRGSTISGQEAGELLSGVMTRNFVQNYESVKVSRPSEADRIGNRYHDAARYVAPIALKTVLQKASGNLGINPENGYFVTDLPDMRIKTLVNQMNTLVDGLVATKEQDRTAPQDELEARLYFIEEFFR